MYFSVQMKLNDVEAAYHCPLCNKPSVQDDNACADTARSTKYILQPKKNKKAKKIKKT
jgi:predicted nucleic acid-binding Zn ribbon protein